LSTKILIVDDHGIVREGLRLLIEQHEDMEVIGVASDGLVAESLVRKLKPDLVIMDVTMPTLNGISATEEIIAENPAIKILALSAHYHKSFITNMLKAGVSGYLIKDGMADELITAIRSVMAGRQYLSPAITKVVIAELVSDAGSDSRPSLLEKLTVKEKDLIQLLAENKTNKEAAKLLCVSVKTIDARRRLIMDKLEITGIADLTKFAIKEGLTSLDF
jgi:DNA-binding NarL/FixJ family response regulator